MSEAGEWHGRARVMKLPRACASSSLSIPL